MGPGFESQRGHKLEVQSAVNLAVGLFLFEMGRGMGRVWIAFCNRVASLNFPCANPK
jgi:hypothetical protein